MGITADFQRKQALKVLMRHCLKDFQEVVSSALKHE
jgi:hypothetical protein